MKESLFFLNLTLSGLTKLHYACLHVTYNVKDITKSAEITLLMHGMPGCLSPMQAFFLSNFLRSVYQNTISCYFSVANLFTTYFMSSKQAGSIKFDAKKEEKAVSLL